MQLKKVMAFVVAATTIISMSTPHNTFATASGIIKQINESQGTKNDWRNNIDEMLAGKKYKEGEVIVVIDNSKKNISELSEDKTSANREVIKISDFSIDTAEAIYGEDCISEDGANSSGTAVTVEIIRDYTKTTRELLNELMENVSIIDAEPNYETEIEEFKNDVYVPNFSKITDSIAEKILKDEKEYPDFSDIVYNKYNNLPDGEAEHYADFSFMQWAYKASENGVNILNWNKAGELNVNGTVENPYVVVIMDTGVDYNHPDLAPVMMNNMTEYSDMGGAYGYNATSYTDTTDPMDKNSHGTHCAGIIAAAWNGEGISGIASGVKLCAVRMAEDSGALYNSSIIRGYEYVLDTLSNGLNVVSINQSYGGPGGTIEKLYLEELQKYGVVVARASGNESEDNDYNAESSSLYVEGENIIVVNSSNSFGKVSSFSNYGMHNTDLFAPGESILSTVPNGSGGYFPFTDISGQEYYYGFSNEVSEEDKAWFKNLDENATLVNNVLIDDSIDDDNYSTKVIVQPKSDIDLFLYIPVEKVDFSNVSVMGISCKTDKEAGLIVDSLQTDGEHIYMSNNYVYSRCGTTWGSVTYDFTLDDMTERSYLFSGGYMVMLLELSNNSNEVCNFYLDGLGLGNKIIPYGYKSGTSMATPVVAGAIAIAASELNQTEEFKVLDKAAQAKKIVSYIKNSVTQTEAYSDKCETGGIINVANYGSDDNIKITDIKKTGNKLTITGMNFGTGIHNKPSISINDKECRLVSWSDNKVTVTIPDKTESGIYTVKLKSAVTNRCAYKKLLINTEYGNQEFEKKISYSEYVDSCHKPVIIGENNILYIFNDENGNGSYTEFRTYNTVTEEYGNTVSLPKAENQDGKTVYLSADIYNDVMVIYTTYYVGKELRAGIMLYNVVKNKFYKLDAGDKEIPIYANITKSNNRLLLSGGVYTNGVTPYNYTTTDKKIKFNNYIIKITVKVNEDGTTVKGNFKNLVKCKNDDLSNEDIIGIYGYSTPIISGSAYADSYVIMTYNTIIWYEWKNSYTELVPKMKVKLENIFPNTESEYKMISGVMTPKGYVMTGLAKEEFDTVIINSDGSVEALQKRLSNGPLYMTESAYMDDTFYAYGFSRFEDENIFLRGTSLEEYEDKVGHDLVKVEAVEATTTTEGNVEHYKCQCCGQLFLDAEGRNKTTAADCRIGIKINSVKNVSNGIKISWISIEGATKYRVYRRIIDGENISKWTKVTDTANTSVIDKKVAAGVVYEYTVRPYYGTTGGNLFSNTAIKRIVSPESVTATVVSTGIKVKWTSVEGATKYKVYRKVSGGSWKALKTTTLLSFTDKTAEKGNTYVYCVKAYDGSYESYITATSEITY